MPSSPGRTRSRLRSPDGWGRRAEQALSTGTVLRVEAMARPRTSTTSPAEPGGRVRGAGLDDPSARNGVEPETVGRRVREERLRQQIGVRELARRVGVSASLISQVELGKASPSVGTLYPIVNELGLSLDELLLGSPDRRRRLAATDGDGQRPRASGTETEPADETPGGGFDQGLPRG